MTSTKFFQAIGTYLANNILSQIDVAQVGIKTLIADL